MSARAWPLLGMWSGISPQSNTLYRSLKWNLPKPIFSGVGFWMISRSLTLPTCVSSPLCALLWNAVFLLKAFYSDLFGVFCFVCRRRCWVKNFEAAATAAASSLVCFLGLFFVLGCVFWCFGCSLRGVGWIVGRVWIWLCRVCSGYFSFR